jgi:hypothetical protein
MSCVCLTALGGLKNGANITQRFHVFINIGASREVVKIARDSWVITTDSVGDRKEIWHRDHLDGDADTEFLDLFLHVL